MAAGSNCQNKFHCRLVNACSMHLPSSWNDVLILVCVCSGTELHKGLLATRSPYLNRMYESNMEEAGLNRVNVENFFTCFKRFFTP